MKVFVALLVVVGLQLAVAQPPCPVDAPQVSCLIDPCTYTRCPNIDGTTCEAYYCGGCFAKFYNAEGQDVTERCEVTTVCRIEGQEYTDCGSACPPTCASPNPGGCIELCIPGCQCPLGEYLDEAANTCVDNLEDCSNDTSPCPPGVPIALCVADPCNVTRCPNYPDARCKSDFCGGCNARFYTDDGTEVTDSCENSTSTCPPGVPLVQCFANPCDVTRCPNYPDAMCLADYCGGCNAIFYDENGEDVSDMCEDTDMGFLSCPPLGSDATGLCFEGCSSNSECGDGELCCSNGCGHTCQDAVTIPYYEPPLQCPNVTGLFGICVVGCTADSVCSNDGDLCCSNGCGTQCTPGEIPYPLCPLIKERASEDSTGLIGAYIPQCQDDGSFSPVQCHGSTGYCWCVNVRTGEPISDVVGPGVDISCTMCTYMGETYNVGEVFPAGDDCNTCTCGRNGLPSCTRIGCPMGETCEYRGQVYEAGDEFPAGDGCNRCSCTDTGDVACTEIACPTAPGNETCRFGDMEYNLGDTFPAGDDCNTCGCTAGGVACTLIYCPVNVTCEYEGREYAVGDTFQADDGCNTCFCGPTGFVACTLIACFDICSLEPDPGPCEAYFPSYYYNPTTEECEIFIYGGCGGNENRFQTLGECLKRCDQDSICLLDPEVGPCDAVVPSYYFDADTGQCEMFDYGGCDGNENRFETLEECARACAVGCVYEGVLYEFGDEFPADDDCNKCFCGDDGSVACTEMDCPDDCELDPEPGLCLAYFPSYFYNSTSEQCESFIYGGCGGNDNRFETVRECLRECDPESICLSEPVEGDCNFITPSYFYNATSERCEEVTYTNCGVNRFANEERCIERCNPDVCKYNEMIYYPGDSFDAGDGCNECFCDRSGYVFCTEVFCVTCEYDGVEYKPGDSFTADDDCNTCRCTAAGNIVCTDIFCPEPCEDGQPQVFCFVDPCQVATCPLFPDAKCEADYCGGCNARFYVSDDDDVDEVTDSCSGPCPDGTLEVDCLLDPCQNTRCPGFPEATCEADYCGGCNARFYDGDREVTGECETCPDGTEEVFCLIDPCETSRCPAFPEARCVSDYCGGCNARYYMGDVEVTEDCAVPKCPADVPTVSCLFNPCDHTTCTRYPEARCVPDYCGGCSAKFYNDEDEVTDECESRTLPPRLDYVSCPPLNSDEVGTCEERCGNDDDCEEGEKCCSNGCGHVCRDDTIVLPYYDHPQECPATSGLVGTICVSLCQYDSDCVGDKLCCAAGCEKTCTTPVPSSNPCKVLANLSPTTIGAYIPQCNDDGNFSPVQCYASTGYCWCVNPETGIPVGGVTSPGQVLNCASCSYNGQTYYPGQDFPSSDGCNECKCTTNGVVCTEIACLTCSLDPDSGTCDGYNPAYYYNSESEQCLRFIYGGCGGNNNKFKTARDCLQSCQSDSICLLDPVPLPDNCEQTGISFFYNSTAGQCEAFAVGDPDCYDANENSFDGPRACLSTCDPDNVGPTDSTGLPCYDIACDIPECGPGVEPISDEEHCCPYCPPEETCEDDEKQCNDGSCIPADYVCDGIEDCPDGEDEPRDDCRVICPFRCSGDGVCIPEEYVCDDWLDCRAGEDEAQCTDPPIDIPHYDPPLTCPDPTDLIGICEEQCRGNSDCPEDELCCSTGCGRSCMEGVPVTPLCRAIRDEVLNRSLIGSYVPQCVDDGSFSPVQCWGSTGYCWCVNTRSGEAVTEPVTFEPNCDNACVSDDERSFAVGDSYTAEDGCNTCLCTPVGAICTAVPCFCLVGDRELADGDSFGDDCSECTCQFGQLNCVRKVCTAPPQPRMRVTMPFNGDFDRIMQAEDDFKRETMRTILMRYRDSLGLMQEQITVSELRKGSVIVVVDIVAIDNQTLGANITILITQMQQDYEAGGLVIRYDNEILQPNGQFESSAQEDDEEEDDEGLSGEEIIIIVVVVVVGLVIVTLIVAGVVLIVMRKTNKGSYPVRASHINPYTEHESVEMKVPLDTPVA